MSKSQPLSVTHPELAKMAVGWNPTRVTYGSKRILEWKCDEGHTFKRSPKNLTRWGTCSVCVGKEFFIGVNDLQTRFPELAKEART